MSFSRSVFVNCPFDDEYLPLLRPLLFTITYLGFRPRIALEALDSGAPRIQKIVKLISASRYAVHDLSRLRARRIGEYFRLNMPFELGVDVGCRLFGAGRYSQKRCLILEIERHRFRAAISDLSGSDIAAHNGDPQSLVAEVRNWLNNQAVLQAPGPANVWGAFLDFMAHNYDALKRRGFSDTDIEKLSIEELMKGIDSWVSSRAGISHHARSRSRSRK